jgi:NAD(P)-dependent dehydrogenase (short-subunit alcohol dehydrogenase family)
MPDQRKYADKLSGQHIVVIGGSSGVGFGVAEACLEEGAATLTITASRVETLNKALMRLKTAYPSLVSRINGDVLPLGEEKTLEGNVKSFFEKLGQKGKLDHIVFTAGDRLFMGKTLAETSLEEIKQAGMVWHASLLALPSFSTPLSV